MESEGNDPERLDLRHHKSQHHLGISTPISAFARSQINLPLVQKAKMVIGENEVAYGCL
jgi:hypothetical protein